MPRPLPVFVLGLLAIGCASAPAPEIVRPILPTPFVCRADAPYGMGPRGMGAHGMSARGRDMMHGERMRERRGPPGGSLGDAAMHRGPMHGGPMHGGPAMGPMHGGAAMGPMHGGPPGPMEPPMAMGSGPTSPVGPPAASPGRPAAGRGASAPPPTPAAFELRRARPDAEASGWATEVYLHAPATTLGAVLVELGRVARVSIAVHPSVAHRPIAVHVEAGSAENVVRHLIDAAGARLLRTEDRVVVTAPEILERRQERRRRVSMEPEPVETRLFRIGDGARARELATVYCHLHASPRGSAATIGDELVVADVASRLEPLARLIDELDGRSTPPPSPTAPPPATPPPSP